MERQPEVFMFVNERLPISAIAHTGQGRLTPFKKAGDMRLLAIWRLTLNWGFDLDMARW